MSYKLGIRDVTLEDLKEVAKLKLMDDDLMELFYMGVNDIPLTLVQGCLASICQPDCVCRCYYELATGKILGVYGITKYRTIWFLSTSDLLSHYREFSRRTKKEFNEFTRGCGEVYNYVHTRHRRALRWLKWLGFECSDEVFHFRLRTELYYKMTYRGD